MKQEGTRLLLAEMAWAGGTSPGCSVGTFLVPALDGAPGLPSVGRR